MKTNSFLIKPLLLLAVLSITSLSTAQAATEKCTINGVKKNKKVCRTEKLWVKKGNKLHFDSYQKYKRNGKNQPAETGYVKKIEILKGNTVVRTIEPSSKSQGSGYVRVPNNGKYSIKFTGFTHRRGATLVGKISNTPKN